MTDGVFGRQGVRSEGLRWEGPVVWWQPVEGQRHALSPDRRPYPGQQRETVCGESVTLVEVSEVDWLMPTCDECMAEACARRDARSARDRARSHTDHTYGRWSR